MPSRTQHPKTISIATKRIKIGSRISEFFRIIITIIICVVKEKIVFLVPVYHTSKASPSLISPETEFVTLVTLSTTPADATVPCNDDNASPFALFSI
jgi:hypothetical protein